MNRISKRKIQVVIKKKQKLFISNKISQGQMNLIIRKEDSMLGLLYHTDNKLFLFSSK
jgi:hypothetical protein